jgi:polyisoprenoid-binding protein YceI
MIIILFFWSLILGFFGSGPAMPETVADSPWEFDGADGVYQGREGHIWFQSEAPLEVIEASSARLRGVIDPERNNFAWTVDVKTFNGFNSPLQREHFHESYLESRKFPKATFTGKIIEKVDFEQDGVYSVRAKGKMNIHGVEQERIIKSSLEVKGKEIIIHSTFTVPLNDHNIAIPKIVHQKIAEEVLVTVNAALAWKE